MNLLIISFSVNGAMGDNFKEVVRLLIGSGINLSILTNTDAKLNRSKEIDICEISFNRHRKTDFFNPYSYFKIWSYIRKSNYDNVLILSPHPVNLFIFKIVRASSLYFYVHDHAPHSGVKGIDSFFIKKQLEYIYSHEMNLIASSHWMKDQIIRTHPNINSNRVNVIYLTGLSNLQFANISSNQDKACDILFFGRLEFYKGLDVLIEASLHFDQNYKCIILAKGNLKEVYGIDILPSNFIHINSYVEDEMLASYIKSCKVVVLPYRDATGTQTIQSVFYYEKPIVATRVGCFPEYITDGEDGIIVEKENAKDLGTTINFLLSHEDVRTKMGKVAKQKLDTIFATNDIALQYIGLFKVKGTF